MLMKRSIAKLVRKKLSDITNTQMHPKLHSQVEKPNDKNCIEELLKEKDALMQLLAERDKIIELTGAELVRLRDNVDKLQQQNWNLAQSNSQILAELNLGRERMKALQHEILCRAALFQGKNSEVREGVEKTEQPLVKASNNVEKLSNKDKKPTKRSRSTGYVTASIKDANESKQKKEIRSPLRRQPEGFKAQECMPMKKNSSQTDYARTRFKILNSPGREETSGDTTRKTEEKVYPHKGISPKVKLRRLE